MNKFEQEYIKIITEWNTNLLLEANLKSLIPNIQQSLIGNKSYQDLNDQEKEELQENINATLRYIERKVNQITDNKQYQSWIYNILKSNEIDYKDMKPISNALLDFNKLNKRPDLKSNQKNIQNYNSLKALQEFIDSFKEEHNLNKGIYKNLKKVYSNKEFTIYFINKDQFEECNKLFGTTDYFSTGWCVAKNKEQFDGYINRNPDRFSGYFVFIKDNKPYALLHYGSKQFKDDSNKELQTNNPNIIDCLLYINNNLNDYNKDDLEYYKIFILLKEHPNATKEDLIAYEIGGEYNSKSKTIDCNGKKVRFKDSWLDENGTFNFNFINVTDDWSGMFHHCKKLKKLPDNFTIPNGVTNCRCMFLCCNELEKLPDNFTIPNSVINCEYMFGYCENLTKLLDNFTIPNGIINCSCMFLNCYNLIELPDSFTIPDNVKDCRSMFNHCEKLTKLPDNFTIPDNITDCAYMFESCKNLKELPKNFSIPKNCNYEDIFSHTELEFKYNPKDLVR